MDMNEREKIEAGCASRRRILGHAYADRTEQAADSDAKTDEADTARLAATFHGLASAHAWGAVWPRPGLDDRARSIATIGILITQGNKEELELHFAAAMRNGFYTRQQLGEIILHATGYAGYPQCLSALNVLTHLEEKAPR